MFDIFENGRGGGFFYFKKTFKNKRNIEPVPKIYENELDKLIEKSRLQNLILTKSLIVKL